MSLDLLVGYVGIVSVGHAAFFGVGAYTAGILAVRWSNEPLLGLAACIVPSALVGLLTGLVILRTSKLALLMLTLCVVFGLNEVANKAGEWTGGVDGLRGIDMAPLLGHFRFDLYGKTAYGYAAVVLLLTWMLVRVLVHSPFGQSLIGIRENAARMEMIGTSVFRRKVAVFTIAAGLAGVAGGLQAQTTQFVGLKMLGFELSGEILVMLAVGGAGRLYGAFVGPAIYVIAQDIFAKENPVFWGIWLGALIIVIVLFAYGGVLGLCDKIVRFAKPLPRKNDVRA
jgi:branched-chain amino acid transport system permease protein